MLCGSAEGKESKGGMGSGGEAPRLGGRAAGADDGLGGGLSGRLLLLLGLWREAGGGKGLS